MNEQDQDLKEKIRQQFDAVIYPRILIDQSPKNNYESLFIHNLVTPYYLRSQQIIDTNNKVILDAGCGSGYKALMLAEANPGAKIIGIDISEESIKTARLRLEYHGFNTAEFYVMSVEDISELCQEFDYINCDEVLYLLPNIVEGLKAMKKVLKPEGIIRTNLHSSIQRHSYYCAQEVFKIMGLMDGTVEDMEIGLARETMISLRDDVLLKQRTWNPEAAKSEEWMSMNYLLQGDKGSTIPELFNYLRAADLEFISMVNWRHWNILDLFRDCDNLPAFIEMSLPEVCLEDGLHLYELLNPIHRTIDFWCGHLQKSHTYTPIAEWTESQWQKVKITLHPQLKTDQAEKDLINCIESRKHFLISNYIKSPSKQPIFIDYIMGACLLPLWQGECNLRSLVEKYLTIMPLNPITLETNTQESAENTIKQIIVSLDPFMYVLLKLDK